MKADARRSFVFFGTLISIWGCSDFKPIVKQTTGSTFGEILVSAPRVSSRQRLVQDRLEQDEWLHGHLAKTDDLAFGIQGKLDIRSAASMYTGASANYDPLATQLYKSRLQGEVDASANAREIAALKAQLELTRLKMQLETAKNQTDPAQVASPYSDVDSATTPVNKAPERPTNDFESTATALSKVSSSLTTAAGRSVITGSPADSSAQASPIDVFRDRLAYREEVRNERIQNALDDRHDLGGNALYRLSFDATILPGNDTSAWAMISVCVRRNDHDERCKSTGEIRPSKVTQEDIEIFENQLEQRWREEAAKRMQELDNLSERPSNAEWRMLLLSTRQMIAQAYTALPPRPELKGAKSSASSSARPNVDSILTQTGEGAPSPVNSGFAPIGGFSNVYSLLQPKNSPTTSGITYHIGPFGSRIKTSSYPAAADVAGLTSVPRPNPSFPLNPTSLETITKIDKERVCANIDASSKSSNEGDTTKSELHITARNVSAVYSAPILLEVCRQEKSERRMLQGLLELGLAMDYLERIADIGEQNESITVAISAREVKFRNNTLATAIGEAQKNIELYAYAGTPKETVQRVSEVASRSQAQEFALALRAMAGVGDISSLIGFSKRNDGLFQALQRQPLVVGFGQSSALSTEFRKRSTVPVADFGWILGPRFTLSNDGNHSQFRHAVIQQGLSAVVSVPAWWNSAELVVRRQWISDRDAKPVETDTPSNTFVFPIRLPATRSSILAMFKRGPEIRPAELRSDIASWTVTKGSEANLVIRGSELWRNPEVMLGGQIAAPVRVLPDMEGLVAHFDAVKVMDGGPAISSPNNIPAQSVPVSIATSEGWKIVGYAKVIDPAAEKPATAQAAKIAGVIIAGKRHRVTLTKPINGFYSLSSSYRKAGTVDAFTAPEKNVDWNGPNELAITPKYKLANGERVELRFHVELKKGNEKELIPTTAPATYYASEGLARIRASRASSPVSESTKYISQVTLTFPPGFEKAYGITSGEVGFEASEDRTRSLEASTCKIERDTCTIRLSWTGAAAENSHVVLRMQNVPEGWFDPSPEAACLGNKCDAGQEAKKRK